MKSSQSNFNLRSPDAYLVRSYLITTVPSKMELNWDFNMTNATLKWFCPNCGCTATLAGMYGVVRNLCWDHTR